MLLVRFCLLEQYLPDGADHPFAQKMIQHFGNLQTPLRSIHKYPALADQERRFLKKGWPSATVRSLWDLWSDDIFLNSEQRRALNEIEPFDEWEEFALFASHYFLLVATKDSEGPVATSDGYMSKAKPPADQYSPGIAEQFTSGKILLNLSLEALPKGEGRRRFGAAYEISPEVIGHYGGLGVQSRLQSLDVYKLEDRDYDKESLPPRSIEARMCHTITNLKGTGSLLVGGRTSPEHALADTWLWRAGIWKRLEDLPTPLYRHCATSVELSDGDQGVLIYGGKSSSKRISGDWILWRSHDRWEKLEVHGSRIVPRFGAVIASTIMQQGILLGGMADDGTVCDEMWDWKVSDLETKPSIELRKHELHGLSWSDASNSIHRLGACLTWSSVGLLLIGGVSRYLLPQKLDIVCLARDSLRSGNCDFADVEPSFIESEVHGPRPLLVGHSVHACKDSVALAGGGAVCFSFGTYWNQHIYSIQMGGPGKERTWTYDQGKQWRSDAKRFQGSNDELLNPHITGDLITIPMSVVPRVALKDSQEFERMVKTSSPVVMDNMDIGPCITEWSLEALKVKVGAHRPIVVHEATNQHMNFHAKNFNYVKKPFGDFVDQIAVGSKQYLRSLASEKPSQQPAQLALDFPQLASDFRLPAQLETVTRNAHSSPLRISGPVVMWLHYDVRSTT